MIRIVHLGLGPLGRKVVRLALERGFRIVAAVDPAPDKVGKDLGEVCGARRLGVRVAPTLRQAIAGKKPDVALVTTVSSLRKLLPQIEELAKAGLPIVCTCEELSFPWTTQPALAKMLDRTCRRYGVPCIGTGVNPGFLMDFLPTVLTSVCHEVQAVRVWRIQDASVRRVPFQQKIGAGLTPAQFRKKELEGTLRHVGLSESVDFIAHRMGWKLDRKTESLAPVIAARRVSTGYVPIVKGMVRGVQQIGRGFVGRREVITLTFRAAVGERDSRDRIEIEGKPSINSTITGGVNGDIATCAILLNAIRSILRATPGLKTMADIAAPAFSRAP